MQMRSPKILVLTSTFPRWKEDTEPAFIYELCEYLAEREIQVDIVAPHVKGARTRETFGRLEVYRYRYFPAALETLAYRGGILANLKKNPMNYLLVPFFLLAQAFAVFSRLKSREYDLVHAHWILPQGWVCALVKATLKDPPTMICTSHGGDLFALDNFIFNRMKAWVINRCEVFCVVSRVMQTRAAALGIEEKKIPVMPMGVDVMTTFKPVAGVNRVARRLIFTGRLVEKKGVPVLLDAIARIRTIVPDVELLVVGDGPLRSPLEEQVCSLDLRDNVRFCGSIPHDQLPALYSSAAIAVVPSVVAPSGDQEGLGLVIIEAMACMCAVVVSSLEAVRDIVDDSTGILVKPGDPEDLADRLCHLLQNPAEVARLAQTGHVNVKERYGWDVAGERYYRLISDLCNPGTDGD